MKVQYFSEFFTYFFKVLLINARDLRNKISVRVNVPGEHNLITLIAPVLINQTLKESCIFLNEKYAPLSLKNI